MLYEWLAAGVGCACADGIFHPLETMKVRMQQHTERSLVQIGRSALADANGSVWRGWWVPGLVATLTRALTYTGFRVGAYPTVKQWISGGSSNNSLATCLSAGLVTGAVGSTIFSPIELIRVRMQLRPACYPTFCLASGLRQIVRAEGGLGSLWRGAEVSIARNALLSATQLATYDLAKPRLRVALELDEGVPLHAATAAITGLVTVSVVQPLDTLRTLAMQGSCKNDHARHDQLAVVVRRRSVVEIVVDLVKTKGVGAFYRGYTPALARLGPLITVQMTLTEQLRSLLGLGFF